MSDIWADTAWFRKFLTQWPWRRGQRSKLRSPNEPPYVICYRLLIHMEAVRVIFGQIQGDHINFTMAAVAAMFIFSAGFWKKKWLLYVPKNMLAKFCVDWCNGVSDIAETKVWRTEGRTDGRRAFHSPPFCPPPFAEQQAQSGWVSPAVYTWTPEIYLTYCNVTLLVFDPVTLT